MPNDDFVDGYDETAADRDLFDPEVSFAAAQAVSRAKNVNGLQIEAHIRRMKQAYVAVFLEGNATSGDIKFVMQDLFWFVQGDTHFFPDARLQDVMAGRKQVLQRISEYTRFDFETLHRMYAEAQR